MDMESARQTETVRDRQTETDRDRQTDRDRHHHLRDLLKGGESKVELLVTLEGILFGCLERLRRVLDGIKFKAF